MKLIHEECGLIADGISNKSGRTTCVTRMAAEGVPLAVGMTITGHKSVGAYTRYDRSGEAQVRAAQKCVGEGSDFVLNVKEETLKLKGILVGDPKRSNAENEEAVKKRKAVTMDADVEAESTSNVDGNNKSIVVNPSNEPMVEKTGLVRVQSIEEYDSWADKINWDKVDGDLASKGVYIGKNIINPATAVFGKTIMFGNNCNITICLGSKDLASAMGAISEVGGNSDRDSDAPNSTG